MKTRGRKRALLAAGLLAMLTAVHQVAVSAAPRPAVSIGAARVTPKRVAASGGPVTILGVPVTVQSGVAVLSVRARAIPVGGGPGPSATLTSPVRNTWAGKVTVLGNTRNTRVNVDIEVTVDSSVGSFSKKAARVQIDPFKGDTSQPPPPPPI